MNMSGSTSIPSRIYCIKCSLAIVIGYLKTWNDLEYVIIQMKTKKQLPRKNVVLSVFRLPPPGGPGGRVPFLPGGGLPPPPIAPSDALTK